MKVSFSLSSSKPSNSTFSSSSDQHDQSQQKKFITEFDPSKTLTDSRSNNPIVFPPIPNQWNPQNQFEAVPSIDRMMLMKLRSDLKSLPEDDTGSGEFDGVPVEEFARAYLKGYVPTEGLGFVPTDHKILN